MADKRIWELTTSTVRTAKFIALDSNAQAAAHKFDAAALIDNFSAETLGGAKRFSSPVEIIDASTTITRDGSFNMVLTDAVLGSKTLTELFSPSVAFGTSGQVPFMNGAGTNFIYTSSVTYLLGIFKVPNLQVSAIAAGAKPQVVLSAIATGQLSSASNLTMNSGRLEVVNNILTTTYNVADTSTTITKDGGNNMVFTDTVSGANTLASLLGASVSFGGVGQVPYTNAGSTDFNYIAGFYFTGTYLTINKSSFDAWGGQIRLSNSNGGAVAGSSAGVLEYWKADPSTEGAGTVSLIRSVAIDAGGTYNLIFETGQDVATPSGLNGQMTLSYLGDLTLPGAQSRLGIGAIGGWTGAITMDTSSGGLYTGPGVISDDLGYTGIKLYDGSVGNMYIFNKRNFASFGNIYFATGATPDIRMTIENGGDVGIGVTNPTERLNVLGPRAGRFTTTTASGAWADFPTGLPNWCVVFAPEDFGANYYNGILLQSLGAAAGATTYALLAVENMSTTDNRGRLNILLKGSGASDYMTPLRIQYDGTIYWQTELSTQDITMFLRQGASTVVTQGWDDSAISYIIAIGTSFTATGRLRIGENLMEYYGSGTATLTIDGSTGIASINLQSDSDGDVIIRYRQDTSTRFITGYDDSADLFQIHSGTSFTTTGSADFSISSAGRIYFGSLGGGAPPYLVYYNTGTGEILFQSTSDMRLKKNVELWEPDSLTFLKKQPLILFDMKDGSEKGVIGWNGTKMKELMPDMVGTRKDGFVNVKDAYMPFHFHRAIKQLLTRIEELENRLKFVQ